MRDSEELEKAIAEYGNRTLSNAQPAEQDEGQEGTDEGRNQDGAETFKGGV